MVRVLRLMVRILGLSMVRILLVLRLMVRILGLCMVRILLVIRAGFNAVMLIFVCMLAWGSIL